MGNGTAWLGWQRVASLAIRPFADGPGISYTLYTYKKKRTLLKA